MYKWCKSQSYKFHLGLNELEKGWLTKAHTVVDQFCIISRYQKHKESILSIFLFLIFIESVVEDVKVQNLEKLEIQGFETDDNEGESQSTITITFNNTNSDYLKMINSGNRFFNKKRKISAKNKSKGRVLSLICSSFFS